MKQPNAATGLMGDISPPWRVPLVLLAFEPGTIAAVIAGGVGSRARTPLSKEKK